MRSERGEGGERSEPGGGLCFSIRTEQYPRKIAPYPSRSAWGEGNPEAGAKKEAGVSRPEHWGIEPCAEQDPVRSNPGGLGG